MSGKAALSLPNVNNLVRVSLGDIDDAANEEQVSDKPSRIEDLRLDPKTEKIIGYRIAAPSFAGNLEPPEPETECWLQWISPNGYCLVPTAFEGQHVSTYGVRVWELRITGPTRKDERRKYFRVPWTLDTELEVRRDLDTLDPERQALLKNSGVLAELINLPGRVSAHALNVSEGGLLCRSPEPILPTHLPLITRFTLDTVCFVIPARVVWSVMKRTSGMLNVENALAFDDPAAQGDILRPLLFQAQMRARRESLNR